jgi:hypothetical protein
LILGDAGNSVKPPPFAHLQKKGCRCEATALSNFVSAGFVSAGVFEIGPSYLPPLAAFLAGFLAFFAIVFSVSGFARRHGLPYT